MEMNRRGDDASHIAVRLVRLAVVPDRGRRNGKIAYLLQCLASLGRVDSLRKRLAKYDKPSEQSDSKHRTLNHIFELYGEALHAITEFRTWRAQRRLPAASITVMQGIARMATGEPLAMAMDQWTDQVQSAVRIMGEQ